MDLGTVRDVFASERGAKIKEELMECRLVEQVKCLILQDNELDQIVNQASLGEQHYMTLASKRCIECCLMLSSIHHKYMKIHEDMTGFKHTLCLKQGWPNHS
jgi:hypothetical protein